jgi:hypothetical protein
MTTWLSALTGVPSARELEWSAEEAEAASLLRDVAVDLDDREAKAKRGADATRLTASIRRRVRPVSHCESCLPHPAPPHAQESEHAAGAADAAGGRAAAVAGTVRSAAGEEESQR